jgi:chemotaxis protein methyltransferase CheR
MKLSEGLCHEARLLIAARLGLDFREQRQADLERGLARACRASSVPAPKAYLAWLAILPDESPEWRRLASHLTVGETYFFRDHALFEALERQVLPSLIATHRAEGTLRLRLWSAGCATGEEPYSLAILLDRLLPDRPDWALTILATDINTEALEKARRGCYREWSFRETPPWVRDRYFHRHGGETFELDARIRRMVTFAPLNLAEDGYPSVVTNTSAMDLILCRNVLMYFTREAQRAAVVRLRRALVTGGWLVVSPSEASAELFNPLVPVNFPGAILYRKEPASVATRLPDFPARLPFGVRSDGLDTPPSPLTLPSEERAESKEEAEAPPAPAADLKRARALADRGDLDMARELCEAALARDRLDPEAHLLLAAICQEQGEIPAALEALRRAIYLAPDCASAHFLMGSLLLQQGDPRRGQRYMETVVRLMSPIPRDEPVPGSDGLTAGRLLETARAYLESPS